jgi:uncharacterized membrane protein
MNGPASKLARCAIYTRKSTQHNLELAFNSLDAQREACEAYIKSQAHEGWRLIPDRYDDGAFSGASLERPALQQLLADVGAGKIDIVLAYKVDRLTRSLADFAKLIELFDAHGVSFVSVTQSFHTGSSMGRLNNHHHLVHTVARVDGLILWANSHLLFWLSLIPAATAWMGDNFLASIPTAVYGTSLLMPAIAYYLLQKAIMRRQGTHSVLANALGGDFKGKISPILYAAGIGLAFVSAWLSVAIYVLVAAMWLIPDRRIENVLREK